MDGCPERVFNFQHLFDSLLLVAHAMESRFAKPETICAARQNFDRGFQIVFRL
jgi:hypothetical protein